MILLPRDILVKQIPEILQRPNAHIVTQRVCLATENCFRKKKSFTVWELVLVTVVIRKRRAAIV